MKNHSWQNDNSLTDANYQLVQSFKNLKTLLKQHKNKLNRNKKRPWILILGASHTGKTTLLSHSGLDLFSPSQAAPNSIKPTRLLDWWIGEEAIFLDLAGKYAVPESIETQEYAVWKQFLKLCKKYNGGTPFDRIILTFDIPSFYQLSDSRKEIVIQRLSRQLLSLSELNYFLPITIVVTQCDRIAGYNDFFSNLDGEEQKKPFGFNVEDSSMLQFSQSITSGFQQLTQRIGEQLLCRLHHEQNLMRRHRIKDFPLQFEIICKILLSFILELPWNETLHVTDLYFTNSLQSEDALNWFNLSYSEVKNLPSTSVTPHKKKSYFIPGMMKNIIKETLETPTLSAKNAKSRLFAIPIALIAVVSATLFWHQGYRESLDDLNIIQKNLYATPLTSVAAQTLPWFPNLFRLQNTVDALSKHSMLFAQATGLIQTKELRNNIEQQYQQYLTSDFQPYLLNLLTNQIQLGVQQNDLGLYNALKTYLMLTTPSRYNREQIVRWFVFKWRTLYPQDLVLQRQLLVFLNNLLNLPNLTWNQDPLLITQAQANLKQLPIPNLIFLEMQDQYSNNMVPVVTDSIPGVNLSEVTIPEFYSAARFNDVYMNIIPQYVNKMGEENWVLGNGKITTMNSADKTNIVNQVRKIYVQYYSKQWLNLIPNISMNVPHSFEEAKQNIYLLTFPQSPLMNLLKIIIGNGLLVQKFDTSFQPSPSVTMIINLINQSNDYFILKDKLNLLNNYIENIDKSNDVLKTSYNTTVSRFQQKGNNDAITTIFSFSASNPQPLQQWLYAIAQGTWSVMLANSKSYIDSLWSSTVIPEYNEKINNKYPINSTSNNQIPLSDFAHFFGPNGTIQTFFQYILQPFVNISGNYWTWNQLNNQSLGIPQSALDSLLRASLIQQMFFTDDPIHLGFKFVLSATSFSSNLMSVTMNLGGQIAVFHASDQQPQIFNWPGPQPEQVVMTFTSIDGKTTTITSEGPWAWFKLLDQASLMTTSNPQIFNLAIQSENLSAGFQIKADNLMNPFIPTILNRFKIPNNL